MSNSEYKSTNVVKGAVSVISLTSKILEDKLMELYQNILDC